MESVQTFFLRRMQTFYVDLTVLQTLPWITLTSVFELSIIWQAFILTIIRQVLRKKHHFSRTQNFTFREILIFQSHSTDGKRSKFFRSKKCKFSTYILRFYKRFLEKFRHLFASYPLYDKSFYIDSNHTSFEKITNFSKTQVLYVSRNLNILVALYGWRACKLFSFEECKLST